MASTSSGTVPPEVLALPIFVVTPTIELCRKAIKDCPGFREVEKDDYTLFNYDFCFRGSFPDPRTAPTVEEALIRQARRECRGIIFDKASGKIIARRFHKFFNVNELDETHEDLINVNRPHVLLDKMDGCLVSPFLSLGRIRWGSKMGVTELSEELENDFLPVKKDIRYNDFCMHWIERGYTPLFEWCSYRQQIIISYPEDMLMLTAIRNMETGAYIHLDEMVKSAAEYNVPVTKPMKVSFGSDYANLGQLLEHVKQTTELEGFVLCFGDGDIYKLKTEWYFARSKKVAGAFTGQEKELWDLILNRKIDDLGGVLGAKRTEVLEHQSLLLWQALERSAAKITNYVADWRKKYEEEQAKKAAEAPAEVPVEEAVQAVTVEPPTAAEGEAAETKPVKKNVKPNTLVSPERRAFASAVQVDVPKEWTGMYFKVFEGADALELVVSKCKEMMSNRNSLDKARHYFAEGIKVDLGVVPAGLKTADAEATPQTE